MKSRISGPWISRIRPRSLRGQMITLVLVGLGLAQVLGFAIYRTQQRSGLQALRDEFVLTRIVSVARLLAETPSELHPRILKAANSRSLLFTLGERPTMVSNANRGRPALLRRSLASLSGYEVTDIQIGLGPAVHGAPDERGREHDDHRDDEEQLWGSHPVLAVGLQLGPNRWLNAASPSPPPEPFWQWSTALSVGLAAIILSVLMIAAVRRVTQPLEGLAAAAERFGRGEGTEALVERGPADVRDTIRAFNRMRTRLERFVRDRTQMLAAISHDLRTPIAALRVRAELIEAPDTRTRIQATLDEMQRMTEATLAFAREDADQEETRLVDLQALVESVCNDLSDMGGEVTFQGAGKMPYRCRSLSMKRALLNLIENAVQYGEAARVSLTEEADSVRIRIGDDGPGIAEQDRERVFGPFVRLETSRSRDTGGAGLGLAIARSIVRRHGGDLRLENLQQGGLEVTVVLPNPSS